MTPRLFTASWRRIFSVIALYLAIIWTQEANADICTDIGSTHPVWTPTEVCIKCVTTETAAGSGKNCTYEQSSVTGGSPCVAEAKGGEYVIATATNETQCRENIDPGPTNTTTTTTPAPPTPNVTTTTTTIPPTTTTTPSTTTSPTPAPAPPHCGFNWESFFGGIAFSAGIAAATYIVWRFWKSRIEPNHDKLKSKGSHVVWNQNLR